VDPDTGFHLMTNQGRSHLESGGPGGRQRPCCARSCTCALKDPAQKDNRDHVDVIIALGMAKEGFDWIWCEHALTIGYRSSLTEIVQIIGRATRDAEGKERSRFTNLIAEPDGRAGRRGRGCERHAQGDLGQPADGAGAGTRATSSRPRMQGPGGL
jgi:hypothetical protein